jgi:hypothetical protein
MSDGEVLERSLLCLKARSTERAIHPELVGEAAHLKPVRHV